MPNVSIIVPCYNEQNTIQLLLEAVCEQTYPLTQLEVIIADGMSTDGTRPAIHAFQTAHPLLNLRIVDNLQRTIPAGVNRALEAAQGTILIRLDAHSKPYPDYVARCVQLLEQGAGDNVGGIWDIQPGADTWIARAIAAAAAHPLAVGDALYRHARQAAEVDTVPFGAFRRSLLDKVGTFNEALLTNEDYEFNVRVKKAGGRIWLDPAIRSVYFARASLLELARQYWRYGFWKWRMLRRNPQTLRWRQALPPVFVLSLGGWSLLALFVPLGRWFLMVELILYFSIIALAGGWSAWRRRQPELLPGLVLAIPVMHIAWGSGFVWSLLFSQEQAHG